MTPGVGTSLTAYARAVERAWSSYVERPVLLSQRDWEHIRDWHGSGIPLDVVRGAIDALSESRKRGKPRGLHGVAAAVAEEWSALREGRSGLPADPPPVVQEAPAAAAKGPAGPDADPAAAWRECLATSASSVELASLLTRLLGAFDRGVAADALDCELDEGLIDAVDPELLAQLEAEVDQELAPWQARLPAADFAGARTRGLNRRLRRRLGLPRLAAGDRAP